MPPKRIRLSSLIALSLALSAAPSAAAAERTPVGPVTVTTFNIKFFGVNGDPDSTVPESRIETIRAHLTRERLWTDVIVFEEIVDVDMLADEVLGFEYDCTTYDHPNPGHQHVVICYKTDFDFAMADDDEDFILEDTTLGHDRYRPVVHGLLKNRSGQVVMHVMGAHFKAYPDFSATRLQQMDVVADYIDQRADEAPVVLLGDFNTYNNDLEQMGALLDHAGEGLYQVWVPGQFTWRSGNAAGHKLDHVWVSRGVRATNVRIAGPCNNADRAAVDRYNVEVSDHCPITLTVSRSRSRS